MAQQSPDSISQGLSAWLRSENLSISSTMPVSHYLRKLGRDMRFQYQTIWWKQNLTLQAWDLSKAHMLSVNPCVGSVGKQSAMRRHATRTSQCNVRRVRKLNIWTTPKCLTATCYEKSMMNWLNWSNWPNRSNQPNSHCFDLLSSREKMTWTAWQKSNRALETLRKLYSCLSAGKVQAWGSTRYARPNQFQNKGLFEHICPSSFWFTYLPTR